MREESDGLELHSSPYSSVCPAFVQSYDHTLCVAQIVWRHQFYHQFYQHHCIILFLIAGGTMAAQSPIQLPGIFGVDCAMCRRSQSVGLNTHECYWCAEVYCPDCIVNIINDSKGALGHSHSSYRSHMCPTCQKIISPCDVEGAYFLPAALQWLALRHHSRPAREILFRG